MILEIDGWRFQIYDVATRKYYAREAAEHCTCAICRNFYKTVDSRYPELRSFLARFGVHMEAPDEMVSFSPTLCANYYSVCGRILERGEGPIPLGDASAEPLTAEEAMIEPALEPCFYLYISTMSLPWVLDEPMETAKLQDKERNNISRLLGRWIQE